MIISRTPLRMSFVGGGSDIPSFYRRFGGAVVSTAIDKYIYVNLNQKFDDEIRISYSKTEIVKSVDEVQHELFREAFRMLGLKGGLEVTTIADIPSQGTGLGSSSSFAVGLIKAVRAYQGKYVSARELGELSCKLEIDICGAPIGLQDQYAAAFGGLNLIEFREDDSVIVSPIMLNREMRNALESRIIVFYTGMVRSASAILKGQSDKAESSATTQAALREMVKLAYTLRDELERGNVSMFGELLHENWMIKRGLASGVTSDVIDDWYERGRRAGAEGGKILGAGAGGFLMFYAPEDSHEAIERALPELKKVKFGFEAEGSKVIFCDR